ncbi:unnamed protein product [Discosporangium mesarthrocarpum]
MGGKAPRKRCGGWRCLDVPYHYILTGCIFLCTLTSYMERQGFSIAFTALADANGVNSTVTGKVLSAFFYGYATMQIPGAWLSARYGGKRVLMLSFFVWGMTSLTMPEGLDNGQRMYITFSRVIIGASQGLFIPASHTVLASWMPPHDRSRLLSLAMSGMYLGSALSLLVFPVVVERLGPAAEWRLAGCMGLAWLLLWTIVGDDGPREKLVYASDDEEEINGDVDVEMSSKRLSSKSSPQEDEEALMPKLSRKESSYKSRPTTPPAGLGMVGSSLHSGDMVQQVKTPWGVMVKSSAVWAIVTNNFGFHYSSYLLMNWLPTYFLHLHRVSLYDMSSMFKVVPYVMMFIMSNVGASLGTWAVVSRGLSVQDSRKMVNTLGFVFTGISMLLMPTARSWVEGLFYTTMALMALGLSRGGWAVNHMDIAPRHAGSLMAVANGSGTCAGVIGGTLTGYILDTTGGSDSPYAWSCATGVAAGVCVMSAVMFATLSRGEVLFP